MAYELCGCVGIVADEVRMVEERCLAKSHNIFEKLLTAINQR